MPNNPKLTVCLDANVIISGIVYGGNPLEILKRLYDFEFNHVTGPNILEKVCRVLLHKFSQNQEKVNRLRERLRSASAIYEPTGKIKPIDYQPDNLVLEVVFIGECDVLVTGDKKHLLPLESFRGVMIESPAHFLKRLESVKNR